MYQFIKNEHTAKLSVMFIFASITLLYSFKTIDRNKVWKNDYTLFTNDVKISENSAKSNCSAGGKILEASEKISDSILKKEAIAQSVGYLRKALSIYPQYRDALLLMGNAQYDYTKNFDSVMYYYLQVVRVSPEYDLIFNNIDLVLANCKDVDQRIRLYEAVWAINPNRYSVNYQLGNLYGKYKQNLAGSLFYLRRAERLNRNNDKAVLKDLGVAMGMSGKLDSALYYFTKALQIDPNDIDLYNNISVTYGYIGDRKMEAAFKAEGLKRKAQLGL